MAPFSPSPPVPTPSAQGAQAEKLAAQFLLKHKLVLLAHNYRCRGGEIDLICRDGDTIVFVEVRLRKRSDYGGAGASITATKQRRLILAARHWLMGRPDCACRFDCILMDRLEESAIQWLRNAFPAA